MEVGSQTAAVEIMLGYDFLDLVKVHDSLLHLIEECRECGESGEPTDEYVSEVKHWHESFRALVKRVSDVLEHWSVLTDGHVKEVVPNGAA